MDLPSANDEMTCRELVEVVSAYLEGTLPADDRARFDAHLEDCPYCLQYVEQMRQTIEVLGELDEESLTPQTQRELLEAFRSWRRR